jgi:hypothetical protein
VVRETSMLANAADVIAALDAFRSSTIPARVPPAR